MPVFNVPITGPDGSPGTIQVNASDANAAQENAKQGGNQPAGDAQQVAANPNAQTSSVNYTAGGGGPQQPQQGNPGAGLDAILQALQAGDQRAFDESVRQFNSNFGLNSQKFQEDIRQYNQNFGLNQAAVTGAYQGAPTLPALTSYATQFGQWGVPQQGQSTLAAQQQQYAQQLGLINQAATLQANPFRQQQAIGQMGNLLGGQGVAGFQAPNTVQGVGTAGGNTGGGMGYLQQMIDDIRSPAANQTSMNQVLQGIPTPNKINSNEFMRAAPSTQSMVLQGMQEKYGLDPNDAMQQIKNTLPGFNAPTLAGQVRR